MTEDKHLAALILSGVDNALHESRCFLQCHGAARANRALRRQPGVRDEQTPPLLLEHYLKQLRLPTMLREFPKLAEHE